LLRLTLTYLSFTSLASILPFFLLPILTRVLTSEQYGQIAMFQLLMSLIGCFIGLSLNTFSEVRYTSDKKKDYLNLQFNALLIYILSSLLLLFILLMTENYIIALFKIEVTYVYWAYLGAFLFFPVIYLLGQLQIRQLAKKYGWLQLFLALFGATFSLLFVVLLPFGVLGRITAIVLSYFICFSIAIFILWEQVLKPNLASLSIDFNEWRLAFKFGVPLIPHLLGGVLIASGERIITVNLLGTDAVALTVVSLQFVSVITIIGQSMNQAYIPWLYGKLNKLDSLNKESIGRLILYSIFVIIALILPIYFIVPKIFILVIGEDFHSGAELVFLLCMACLIQLLYLLFVNFLFFKKKTMQITFISLLSGVLHFIFVYFFVSNMGVIGVPISFICVRTIQLVVTVFLVIKSYPFVFPSLISAANSIIRKTNEV